MCTKHIATMCECAFELVDCDDKDRNNEYKLVYFRFCESHVKCVKLNIRTIRSSGNGKYTKVD